MHGAGRRAVGVAVLIWAARLHAAPSLQSAAGVEAGARALALGDAGVAAGADPSAIFSNPAGLATLPGGGLMVGHRRLKPGLTLDSACLALQAARERPIVLGVGAHLLRIAGTPSEEALGGFAGNPGESGYVAQLQAAWRATPAWALGLGVGRVATLAAGAPRATGWSTSAGLAWHAGGTRVGLALRDLTFGLRPDSAGVRASRLVSLGVQQGLWSERAVVALQFDGRRDTDEMAAGIEYWAAPFLALRSGMRRGLERGNSELYSLGIGTRHAGLQLDYAWRGAQETRPEHIVSVHWSPRALQERVPNPPPAPPQPRAERAAPPSEARVPVIVNEPSIRPAPREDSAAPVPARVPTATPQPAPQPAPSAPKPALQAPPIASPPNAAPAPPSATTQVKTPPPPVPALPNGGAQPASRFVVRAGIHADLDSAAQEIARLYRGELHPTLERKGSLYVVVVRRCATRAEALDWQKRARDAGVRCSVDEE